MYIIVDGNNFYVSCERVGNPSLNNKPVAVMSNNDGCAIAMSNEAKAIGIKMGDPTFKIRERPDAGNITLLSSNYALYGDISARMVDIIRLFAPEVEVYSIDECFGKIHGVINYEEKMRELRKTILQWIGIPTCIGIAPTKSLAKAANRIAKKFPEHTGGVYAIDSEKKRINALKWLEIGDVWGIGNAHADRLRGIGIKTAYDFTKDLSNDWIKKNMAIVGFRLCRDLSGLPTLDFEDVKDKKMIAHTRTFDKKRRGDFPYVKERVSTFAANVAEKLRAQKSFAATVHVFIQGDYKHRFLPGYSIGLASATDYPTNSTFEIKKTAIKILEAIWRDDFDIAKTGVMVSGITPAPNVQTTIFGYEKSKDQVAMAAIDKLNLKFGRHAIRFGGEDRKLHKMLREHLSRNYASNINEIIEIR